MSRFRAPRPLRERGWGEGEPEDCAQYKKWISAYAGMTQTNRDIDKAMTDNTQILCYRVGTGLMGLVGLAAPSISLRVGLSRTAGELYLGATLLALVVLELTVGKRVKSLVQAQRAQYEYRPSTDVNENIKRYTELEARRRLEKKWWQVWLSN